MVIRMGGKLVRLYAISSLAALLITTRAQGGESSDSSTSANHNHDRIESIEHLASAVRSSFAHNEGRRARQRAPSSIDNKRRATRRRRKQQQLRSVEETSTSQPLYQDRDLIVGGTTAPPGRFPYSVSLQLEEAIIDQENGEDELNNVHTCGATLVAMDVILTAGHCGYQERGGSSNMGDAPKQLFFGADVGAYNLRNGFSGSTNDEVDNLLFEKLIVHPEYTGFHGADDRNGELRLQHDVMLVKLYGGSDKPVVRLHNPGTDPEPTLFEKLVVAGWGDRSSNLGKPDLPDILHYASVNYIPNEYCENFNGYTYLEGSDVATFYDYEGKVSDDMMCAVSWEGQDACQGDSGGGLIRVGNSPTGKSDVQVGITSWGVKCGNTDFAGVYSRISEHYDWIRDNICELSDKPPDYMNCPIKPYPPGSIYSAPVTITITFQFDDNRGESGWLLETIPDFRNVAFSPFGTYASESSVNGENSISETLRVQSGRFYLLTLMDEFADGFCCDYGKGSFRVDASHQEQPIVPTTLGLLWTKHALRRAFYISEPNDVYANPPTFVTVVLTLGYGADPGKFLYLALENIQYDVLLLYEIQPLFATTESSRVGESGSIYSQVYKVPVFDVEFGKQRYNVISYDDNERAPKASFEVYFGDISPENLLLAQSGHYGNSNNVARSFVLFKSHDPPPSTSLPSKTTVEFDTKNAASSTFSTRAILSIVSFLTLTYASC